MQLNAANELYCIMARHFSRSVVWVAESIREDFYELNLSAIDDNRRVQRSAKDNRGGPAGMHAKAKRSGLHSTLRASIVKQKNAFEKNSRTNRWTNSICRQAGGEASITSRMISRAAASSDGIAKRRMIPGGVLAQRTPIPFSRKQS